jgi:broad specificity phosphatase PhoE/CTP:molybdopterin cytidylyltransferase MocA
MTASPAADAPVVGVILAAGFSSRMGAFKALLDVGGKSAVSRLTDALREAGARDVVIVTGHERERLAELIRACGAVEAFNERFPLGMFTSVKAGLEKALAVTGGRASAFLLLPVDCPMTPASAIRALIDAHRGNAGRFIVPCYRGKKGHPLLIPIELAPEILAHDGEGGLKAVTDRYDDDMLRIETGDEGVVLDMDGPAGYEEVKSYCARFSEAGRAPSAADATRLFAGRLFLIRHGETEKHAEAVFLGGTDVPLSEEGRRQAVSAAEKLAAYGARAAMLHTSDLSRATETADIIAKTLHARRGGVPPATARDARLREMHLGEWDGRFIREIKEAYPDEYARRGARILTWKRGHDGENYYDLRYRVEKWLSDALPGAEEIVAVTHSGVIKVITAAFSGMTPEEAWALRIPRGAVIELNAGGGEMPRVLAD